MKYEKDIRDKELEKLKKTPFFDDETLKEIREDLNRLNNDHLKKTESKIEINTNEIISTIPLKDSVNYFKTIIIPVIY